jgi:solute carrier family 13 (sodium-dependent dicarboxylate transporter), member 2/3/5
LSISERRVATVFGLTGMMWVVRRWLASGTGVELNDTTIAMIGGISLFLIPADEKKNRSLLTWNEAKGLPWEILLLFGGGLTLANALNEAGVLTMAADAISSLQGMNGSLLVFVLVAFALLLTEVMSNLALTIVMVPVVGQVAISWGMDPLLLVIPVTMASSCAFMLPMATPPNAIIFGSNKVSMGTMASVGLILNLIAAVLAWIWGLFVLPVWMQIT